MKTISLTKGMLAIVDDDDYDKLSKFKWMASYYPKRRKYNACRSIGTKPHQQTVLMHRIIMNALKGSDVDHINGDTLDNRKSNLRICTRAQNMANVKARSHNKLGVKGVYKSNNRFRATIRVNHKRYHLGYFDSLSEASAAYNKAARENYGDFALLKDIA
jgi:hypothetical protein